MVEIGLVVGVVLFVAISGVAAASSSAAKRVGVFYFLLGSLPYSAPMIIVVVIAPIALAYNAYNTLSNNDDSSGSSSPDKTIISETQAKSLLRGCCSGAGGTWSSYDDCVSPNYSAFSACADDGNTYIRFSSGREMKLDASSFIR